MTPNRRTVVSCFDLAAAVLLGLCGCSKRDKSNSADTTPPPDTKGDGNRDGPAPSISLIVPTRPALPAGWVEFKHPDGAFTVYTPGRPRPEDGTKPGDLLRATPGIPPRSVYGLDSKQLSCRMEVNIFPPDQVEFVREQLKRVSDHYTNSLPGKTIRQARRTVTWAGHPAEEVEVEKEMPDDRKGGKKSVRIGWLGRTVWIGGTMYSFLLVGNDDGRPTAADRAAFFDSFVPGK